jgi:hypothetical protein
VATEVAASPSLLALPAAARARGYERCRPEETELHAVVREQLETFLARAREHDHPVPRFIEQELRAFLACGVPSAGLDSPFGAYLTERYLSDLAQIPLELPISSWWFARIETP